MNTSDSEYKYYIQRLNWIYCKLRDELPRDKDDIQTKNQIRKQSLLNSIISLAEKPITVDNVKLAKEVFKRWKRIQ